MLCVLRCWFCNAVKLAGSPWRTEESPHLQEQAGVTLVVELVLLACKTCSGTNVVSQQEESKAFRSSPMFRKLSHAVHGAVGLKAPGDVMLADPSALQLLLVLCSRYLSCP